MLWCKSWSHLWQPDLTDGFWNVLHFIEMKKLWHIPVISTAELSAVFSHSSSSSLYVTSEWKLFHVKSIVGCSWSLFWKNLSFSGILAWNCRINWVGRLRVNSKLQFIVVCNPLTCICCDKSSLFWNQVAHKQILKILDSHVTTTIQSRKAEGSGEFMRVAWIIQEAISRVYLLTFNDTDLTLLSSQ